MLPRVHGRAPRVAVLVYNHAANDSRVLKTAASLQAAGAQVRIFAVARARAGYGEGRGVVGEGLEVDRAPEFELARYAPRLLWLARRLTGRPDPAADQLPPTSSPGEGASPNPQTTFAARSARSALGRSVNDLWLRVYRTVSLGLYWWHAHRSVRAWGPDVVHACDGNTLAPAVSLARVTGARVVYDAHELWRHRNVRPDRPVAPWVEGAIERIGIRRAAGVVTVSPSIASWLHERYRLPRVPTLVRNVPTARTERGPAVCDGAGQPPSLRARAGVGHDVQVVGYAGRITTARGLEETLAALALLPDRVHLVLLGYGEPDYLNVLHGHIAALGLARRVHFVAAVAPEQVPVMLAAADLSVVIVRPVCLSYRFSLPNKLFESMHAGVPVVAADLPDLSALVRRYGVGEVVDVCSPSQLADAMSRVLANPGGYRQAAAAARDEVTWAHEAIGLIDLYTEVMSR